MFALLRKVSVLVALVASVSLAACGGSGGGGGNDQDVGNGQIILTGFLPQPVQGCGPVPFTITGQNFETVVGTTAQVTFRAIDGTTPFLGGDSDRATVTASVTSDTTIEGLTPPILICGQPSITCEIDVMLESGVQKTSTGIFTVTFNAPTIQSINPNPIPAALPTPFTITGTGFGPVGGPVTIRFTGDNGALLFKDGTKNFADVFGQVVNSTTITGITPIATVCGVPQTGASIQLFFPDGCCSLPTDPGFVNFTAPVIINATPNPVAAAIQQVGWTINGANFGPVNTVATVRFIADGGFALFDDGTTPTIDVPGLVTNGGNSVQLTTPLAAVCGVASRSAAVRVISPFGSSCAQTGAGFVTFLAPALTAPTSNPPTVPGAIPTQILVAGTNFGPTGSSVVVRFTADGGATIFDDGTTVDVDAIGVITNPTTVTVTTPLATVCGIATRSARVRVFAPAGGACVDSAAGYVTFQAPTFTSVSPTPVAAYPAPGTTFTVTGAGFGPAGSPVAVTFRGDNGANLFGNGSMNETTVVGSVVNATTITGVLPTATVCGASSATASVRLELQNGSCVTSGSAAITFNAPTVTGFSVATVPSSIPTTITINGTNFGPTNGVAQVVFISDPISPAIFGDGTLVESAPILGQVTGTGTITVLTPHATVLGASQRNARVRVTLSNGSCATSVATLGFTAPALTTVAGPTGGAAQFNAAVPSAFVINGSNFGPIGSEVTVRFTDTGPGTRFANATSATFDVPGTVQSATQIAAVAPLVALCPQSSMPASIAVYFQDGSRASNTIAITYVAPAITGFSTTGTWVSGVAVPFTVSGTNFGPTNSQAAVKFTAAGTATPFGGGTLNEITVTGTVTGAGTITGLTPVATLCGVSSLSLTVQATFQGGACAVSAAGAATVNGPGSFVLNPTSVAAYVPTAVSLTGANFPAVGTPVTVTLRAQGAATPFGAGTSQQLTIITSVTGANTVAFTTPIAEVCANVATDVLVSFGNAVCPPTSVGTLTLRAPTFSSIGVSNVAGQGVPPQWRVSGADFPAVGSMAVLRIWEENGLAIFAGGTQSQTSLVGTVTATGPDQAQFSGAAPVICGNAPSIRYSVRFLNAPCEVLAPLSIAASGWGLGGVSPSSSVPALQATSLSVPTGFTPFILRPADGTLVTVEWVATAPIFADGTSSTIQSVGVYSGGTVTFTTPLATICGAASAAATIRVRFPDGSCTSTTTITFQAPQLPATPSLAFTPQNVPFAGAPFTIGGLGTPNVFAPTGAAVTVRFSGPQVFSGGMSTSIDVPGQVVNATTITGVAPPIWSEANAQNVNVQVLFEDGSCTNVTTASYYRLPSYLAVIGGTNTVRLIDTSTATVASTITVGAATALTDVAIDRDHGRMYLSDSGGGTVLHVIDLNAGTVAGAPVPASIGALNGVGGLGLALDDENEQLYVATTAGILKVVTANYAIYPGTTLAVTGLTGRIELDPDNDQIFAVAEPAEDNPVLVVLDTNLNQLPAGIPVPSPYIGGASWTGGFALDTQRNLLFLTFTDTGTPAFDGDPTGQDFIEVRPSSVPTVSLAVFATPAYTDDPSGVLAAEPHFGQLGVYMAGSGNVDFFDIDLSLQSFSAVAAGPSVTPTGAPAAMAAGGWPTGPKVFISDPVGGQVRIVNTTGQANTVTNVAVTAPGSLHFAFTGTSP